MQPGFPPSLRSATRSPRVWTTEFSNNRIHNHQIAASGSEFPVCGPIWRSVLGSLTNNAYCPYSPATDERLFATVASVQLPDQPPVKKPSVQGRRGHSHSDKGNDKRGHPPMWTSERRCPQVMTVRGHVNGSKRTDASRVSPFAGHKLATTSLVAGMRLRWQNWERRVRIGAGFL